MCWKTETRLADLKPDFRLTINRKGLPPIVTTPRELIQARLAACLTIDQVEFAFDTSAALPSPLNSDTTGDSVADHSQPKLRAAS